MFIILALLAIIILIILAGLGILIPLLIISNNKRKIENKHVNFVHRNSILLQKLNEINQEFIFYPYVSYDQSHEYDNEKFYNDITEQDYLVYQLQYYSSKIIQQFNFAEYNKKRYEEYINYINQNCQRGQFKESTETYDLEKLLEIEQEEFRRCIKNHPCTSYAINVTLFLTDINGIKKRKKTRQFNKEEVFSLIQRLKNKNGTFYNDKYIWDEICRVERGKVSNKMRFAVYKRDGYRCRYCGRVQNEALLEVDHIIPIAKGGKTTYENLQTLCHDCNVNKGDKLL